MRALAALFISALLSNVPAPAQNVNRFSIQVGYLYSTSRLIPTSTVLIGIPTPDPTPGLYAGLAYEHQVSTLLTSQLELTYQQKGYANRGLVADEPLTYTYRYLGITPMIGIRPIKNLGFLVGPALNVLLNQSTSGVTGQPLRAGNRSLEFGLMGRSSYQFQRISLTVGYFKGLTGYYKSDYYYLTNQTWQLGLLYQLSKR